MSGYDSVRHQAEKFLVNHLKALRRNARRSIFAVRYGAARLYADSMIRIYRQHYGLFTCSAILFNHESPCRGLCLVTREITHEAAKIRLGLTKELHLGNLDARRHWGFAGDYARAIWLMLQQSQPDDYVLATGERRIPCGNSVSAHLDV